MLEINFEYRLIELRLQSALILPQADPLLCYCVRIQSDDGSRVVRLIDQNARRDDVLLELNDCREHKGN